MVKGADITWHMIYHMTRHVTWHVTRPRVARPCGGDRVAVAVWRWPCGGDRVAVAVWRWPCGGGRVAVAVWRSHDLSRDLAG